ncbi:MAG: hypothetical protein ACR2KE_04525 [Candidatus Nanopelagicales bacterium]
MSNRSMRAVAAAVAASAVAVVGLALAAPSATAGTTGTLKLEPGSGTGADPVSVVTSAGCSDANATHFVVTLTGTGVQYTVPGSGSTGPTYEAVNYMVGNTALGAVGSSGESTTAIRVPLSKLFGQVKQENKDAKLPTGEYTLTLECRTKLSPTAISSFTTKVTIVDNASGLSFREGAMTAVASVTAPKISGTAKVGQTLKVSTGTWSPTPSSYTYAWKIGTKVVSTKNSYKVAAADKGKKVTVTVTAKADGYKDGTASASVTIAKK